MTIDVNDILRIVLQFTMSDAVLAQVVQHFLVSAGSGESPNDVLDDILTAFDAAFDNTATDMVNDVAGDEISLLRWDAALEQWDGLATTAATQIVGLDAGEMLPHGIAPVVKFFTTTGRRQGRKFLPGWAEDTQSFGNWSAPTVTSLINFAIDWNDPITSGAVTVTPGVFNTDSTSPLFETFAAFGGTVSVNTICGYQRRRKAGVGI